MLVEECTELWLWEAFEEDLNGPTLFESDEVLQGRLHTHALGLSEPLRPVLRGQGLRDLVLYEVLRARPLHRELVNPVHYGLTASGHYIF